VFGLPADENALLAENQEYGFTFTMD
jgi:hypothetical protein